MWDKEEGVVGLEEIESTYPSGIVVAGTGHRWFGGTDIVGIVQDWINNMLHTIEPRKVITGMAVGFDTYLAREALMPRRIGVVDADLMAGAAEIARHVPTHRADPDEADVLHAVVPGLVALIFWWIRGRRSS